MQLAQQHAIQLELQRSLRLHLLRQATQDRDFSLQLEQLGDRRILRRLDRQQVQILRLWMHRLLPAGNQGTLAVLDRSADQVAGHDVRIGRG